MEIKVLGTGCSSCKALYETTKQAISELGCDATLIKEEDLLKMKIMHPYWNISILIRKWLSKSGRGNLMPKMKKWYVF